MKRIPYPAGTRFQQLTVKEYLGIIDKRTRYLMVCDCGKEKICSINHVTSGIVKSCGCRRKNKLMPNKSSDGLKHHPLYETWKKIMARCYLPSCAAYHRYGGRGISVHPDWHSARNFIGAVGERPSKEHQIDRINNDGNYEPGNVRWVTKKENSRNTCRTLWLEYGGKLRKMIEVCEETGLSRHVIQRRYKCKKLKEFTEGNMNINQAIDAAINSKKGGAEG